MVFPSGSPALDWAADEITLGQSWPTFPLLPTHADDDDEAEETCPPSRRASSFLRRASSSRTCGSRLCRHGRAHCDSTTVATRMASVCSAPLSSAIRPRPALSARSKSSFFSVLKVSNLVSCGSGRFRRVAVRSVRREGFGSVKIMASAEVSSSFVAEADPTPFGVLFVCLGNICRSPTAEAVFRDVVEKRNLDPLFNIDSAGTIDYHEGNPADSRMKAAALKRGVKLTSISRPIRPSDFVEFDLILAMDNSNRADIFTAYESWNRRSPLPAGAKEKVKLMCSYCTKHQVNEVPDPYYGGPAGFEKVLDLLDDACEGLLASIQELQVKDGKVDVKTSI